MELQIGVCMKPVPDPKEYDKITIDPVTKTITRKGIPTIINPVDKNAIEAALRVREQFGGKVTVVSMAPPEAKTELTEALAMGADEALLLSDRAFAGADTLATSYTLAQGLNKLGRFDLIITGTESADGATSQVPAQLAVMLNVSHLWNVKEFVFENKKQIRAKVKMDNAIGEYLIQLPALLGVSREINKPRYVTALGIIKAKKKPLTVWGKDDLQVDTDRLGLKGSPTQPGDIYAPSMGRKGQRLEGTKEEITEQILTKLQGAGVNISASKS